MTRLRRLVICSTLSLIAAACTASSKKIAPPATQAPEARPTPAPEPPEGNLTRIEAQTRAREISNIRYDLSVELDSASSFFTGHAKIRFDGRAQTMGFLDFHNTAKVLHFAVNGTAIPEVKIVRHRLELPLSLLKAEDNLIEIDYQQSYARDGRGLHRFVDPEDERVYLYSNFEPFDAHRFMPCFDQPDLKAKFKLTVTAPHDWTVISTQRDEKRAESGATTVWTFPETPPLSPYLFSLHAGPYQKWESKAGGVPLRLFARQSFAPYIRPNEWFGITSQGLKFFADYFDTPYPFQKYDQVILPDFSDGGMENAAAATFSENTLSRGVMTRDEQERLADLILHELAHMWFGDLVTLRWWNGLWLNESFSTYMASLAKVRATEFTDAWVSFHLLKTAAYIEDQLVTSHPIEAIIPDTDAAFANFDSITYRKGAAVLKQLHYFLGEDKFRAGVRTYFKRHAWGNTTIEDFIAALEESSQQSLGQWSNAWLESAGLDTLQADYVCSGNKVKSFRLKARGPNDAPTARPHRTRVSLFKEEEGRLVAYQNVRAKYQGPETEITELKGAECPAMVYPNENDQDYVKVRLDDNSVKQAKKYIGSLPVSFRAMLWPDLFAMVRDLKLKPQEFLEVAIANLESEKNPKVFEELVHQTAQALHYLPQASDSERGKRLEVIGKIEKILWSRLENPATAPDSRLSTLDALVKISETKAAAESLRKLLSGEKKVAGLTIDQDRRWGILIRLASLGENVDVLFNIDRLNDRSERGVTMAMAFEAAKPSLENKRKWISRLVNQTDLSLTQKEEIYAHLLPDLQAGLRAGLATQFYASLPSLAKTKDMGLVSLHAHWALPAVCTNESAARLYKFIQAQMNEQAPLPGPILKELRIGHQEDEICTRVRLNAL